MLLKEWLQHRPFTLSMSSGFFSFFAHAGMLSALVEENLLPQRVTGSSAGALVGASFASGVDMETAREALFQLKKADFWDPGFGFGILKGELFRSKLREFLAVETFEECPTPLAISVFDWKSLSTRVLDRGDLVEAVYASCAFPVLFQPLAIGDACCSDGGILDRPGMAALKDGERVLYHHIKSRSPWRRKNSPALQIPGRSNMRAVSFSDLPRVGPNALHLGPEAFDMAYREMKALLNSITTAAGKG